MATKGGVFFNVGPFTRRIEIRHELGDECPNCHRRMTSDERHVEVAVVPSRASWTCPHCGWKMTAAYHGRDNHAPRLGDPLT